MPAWLITALKLIQSGLVGTPVRALATGGGVGLSLSDPFFGDISIPGFGGTGRGKGRRRRRRALSASDKVDIAFVAGLLGPKAGKDLAVIIAARS